MDERTLSFGYRLRRRRKALDLTQEQLADGVNCSRFTIRKIEADERRPSRRLAERLAQKLSVPAHERDGFLAAARAATSAPAAVDGQPMGVAAPAASGAPAFVGRDGETGLLRALLARLHRGSGHVALVEGEPGIGKSRLLQEVADYSRACGLAMLATRCYEIERAMPYQPVIDLATQAIERAQPATLQALAPVSLAEIAALVPDLAERVAVAPLSSDFPEARQARLFRSLVQLLDAVSAGHPLLVIVDDLQWADEASTQFLHYLGRQAARRPMLALYAMRDEDVGSDARLAACVASLRGELHARHLPLARLRLSDTQALLHGLEHALVERLHRETDGNPFFLTSMREALQDGRIELGDASAAGLPEALRASVRARLAHVPPAARAALDVAAVLGRQVEFDTLVQVTGEPEADVLQAIDALVARRLLREDPGDGTLDFTHDKVREVTYLEMGAGRRQRLHRAAAEVLAAHGEDDARLAEHFERGHAWATALHHMLRAARQSQRLFAMREALHWFDRAITLARARPDALGPTDLIALHDERGSTRAQAGLTAGAVDDIGRVIEAARARGDRAAVRDALIRLGMAHRRADDYEAAVAALGEALRESRATGDERHAADTLYHLGTVAWSDGRNGEAITFHAEAVAICERLGLSDLVAVQAWHGRGEAHFNHGEPVDAIACWRRSIALAQGIGDRSYEAENRMMLGFACVGDLGLGDYPQAEAHFETALEMARAADLQWHLGPTLIGLDHVRACTGRYGAAWTGLSDTLRWLQGVQQTRYQLMAHHFMGRLLIELGLHARAAALLERAIALAQEAKVRFWLPLIESDLAVARLRLGRDDAGPLLESAQREARRQRERTHLMRCLEGLAELALARGDTAAALGHAEELLEAAQHGRLAELEAVARRWRGLALAARGQRDAAIAELQGALLAAQRLGRVRLAFDAACGLAALGGATHALARELADRMRASLEGTELVADLPVPA